MIAMQRFIHIETYRYYFDRNMEGCKKWQGQEKRHLLCCNILKT